MDLFTTAFLSGLFAALVAIAVTRAIEYYGGTIGGIIATLPTTIIPASIGIILRLNGNNDKLSTAMFTVPIGMLISGLFLFQWRFWPKRLNPAWSFRKRLLLMICISLGIWLTLAIIMVSIEMYVLTTVTSIKLFGMSAYLLSGIIGISACFRPLDAPAGTNRIGWKILILRGCMAGMAIFITVSISSINSIAAGIASAFPAIFLTIMVGLWVSQGEAVTTGAVGPMMLGGMSPPGYAILFALLYPEIGLIGTVIISWICAVAFISVPAAYFIKWRRSVTAKTSTTSKSNTDIPSNTDKSSSTTIKNNIENNIHNDHDTENERVSLRSTEETVLKHLHDQIHITTEDNTSSSSISKLSNHTSSTITENPSGGDNDNEEENKLIRNSLIHTPVYISEEGRGII